MISIGQFQLPKRHLGPALVLLLFAIVSGQRDYQEEALSLHNRYRALHEARPLTLHPSMNARAQACADYYARIDEQDHSCPYLEGSSDNIGRSRSSFQRTDAEKVALTVNNWYRENELYDYNYPGGYKETSHFTQMVWKDTQYVGFGVSRNPSRSGRTYVVATYYPKGNYVSLYTDNVTPRRG